MAIKNEPKQKVIDATSALVLLGQLTKDEANKIVEEWSGSYYTHHELTHACKICGEPIINLYYDPGLKVKVQGDLICWPCEEFGGPVDDMDLWEDN